MKVYVMTKAKPFNEEIFVDIKATRKEAESEFKKKFPHMRVDKATGDMASDKEITWLLFIHEKTI